MVEQEMNKEKFLKRLEELLSTLPKEERKNAITYYEEYFKDAGEENESVVIKELGNVEDLAKQIKSEDTFKTNIEEDSYSIPSGKNNDVLAILLLIVILIFGLPVILPVILTILGVAFGVLVSGVVVGIVGIALAAVSIVLLFSDIFAGILTLGVSLLLLALGICLTITLGVTAIKVIPICVRWFVNLCRKVIGRGDL